MSEPYINRHTISVKINIIFWIKMIEEEQTIQKKETQKKISLKTCLVISSLEYKGQINLGHFCYFF